MMQSCLKLSLLLLILLHLSTLILSSHHHNNISHLLTYSLSHHFDDSSSPSPSPFLKEVLKAIAVKKKWDLGSITVSKLEKVWFGYSKSHTFPVRITKRRDLVVRYSQQVGLWQKFDNVNGSFEQIVNEVKSEALLPPFIVDGPVQVVHSSDDQLSLHLPMNTSFSGLKHIVVGEGISIEIQGAKEVSFPLSSCNDIQSNSTHTSKGRHDYWPLLQSFCPSVPPMHVVGPVNITAFRRNLTISTIHHNFLGRGMVKLKVKKCYKSNTYRQTPSCPGELSLRIRAAKHLLRTILDQKMNSSNHSLSFHKVTIKASTFVRFQLELDREVGANDSVQGQLPEWRTKPARERVWFDIVARVDDEKLRPVSIKPLKPFIGIDSTSWSYLFSNISLSEFSSLLLPSHPLTLDVKW